MPSAYIIALKKWLVTDRVSVTMIDLHCPNSVAQPEHDLIQVRNLLGWREIISTSPIPPVNMQGLVDVLARDD